MSSTSSSLARARREVEAEGLAIVDEARQLEVHDAESCRRAGEFVVALKDRAKRIEAAFAEVIRAAHRAHKTALAERDKYLRPVREAERILSDRIGTWHAEQERRRREEQERLLREAQERAEIEREIEADILRRSGREAEAAQVEQMPVVPESVPIVRAEVEQLDGLSLRTRWAWRIVDESAIPREYMRPDEAKIGRAVRALGKLAKIPGVEVYEQRVVARRGN